MACYTNFINKSGICMDFLDKWYLVKNDFTVICCWLMQDANGGAKCKTEANLCDFGHFWLGFVDWTQLLYPSSNLDDSRFVEKTKKRSKTIIFRVLRK